MSPQKTWRGGRWRGRGSGESGNARGGRGGGAGRGGAANGEGRGGGYARGDSRGGRSTGSERRGAGARRRDGRAGAAINYPGLAALTSPSRGGIVGGGYDHRGNRLADAVFTTDHRRLKEAADEKLRYKTMTFVSGGKLTDLEVLKLSSQSERERPSEQIQRTEKALSELKLTEPSRLFFEDLKGSEKLAGNLKHPPPTIRAPPDSLVRPDDEGEDDVVIFQGRSTKAVFIEDPSGNVPQSQPKKAIKSPKSVEQIQRSDQHENDPEADALYEALIGSTNAHDDYLENVQPGDQEFDESLTTFAYRGIDVDNPDPGTYHHPNHQAFVPVPEPNTTPLIDYEEDEDEGKTDDDEDEDDEEEDEEAVVEKQPLKRTSKRAKGILKIQISDEELKAQMERAWENDRLKKKERKAEREALRAQGLLGMKADDIMDLHDAVNSTSLPPPTNQDVIDELVPFLNSRHDSHSFRPMEAKDRARVHRICNAIGLKTLSRGQGSARYTTVTKTSRTMAPDHPMFRDKMGKFVRAKQGRVPKGFGFGGGRARYNDGDVVGATAPELGDKNRGRAMLEKMGWAKGDALGIEERKGILTPVTHVVKNSKIGLG